MQGVLRDQKRKNSGEIKGLQQEANRTKEWHERTGRDFDNSDIDWNRTEQNRFIIKTEDWNKALKEMFAKYDITPRKNSVLGFDTV